MKYPKILGLAAIAAVALMAIVGVGTASATVLCTGTPAAGTDCTAKEETGQTLDASVETSALLKTNGGTTIATCTEGTIRGYISSSYFDSTNEKGEIIFAEFFGGSGSTTETVVASLVDKLTWGKCTTTVNTLANGSLEVHHIAGTDNGTATSTGAEVTVKFLGVSCVFRTGFTDIGTLTGGNPATFDISATIPGISGGLCPTSGIWSGGYKFTTPSTTLDVAAG